MDKPTTTPKALKVRTNLKAGLNPQPLPPRELQMFSFRSLTISLRQFAR